jgi:hypothetical protein
MLRPLIRLFWAAKNQKKKKKISTTINETPGEKWTKSWKQR